MSGAVNPMLQAKAAFGAVSAGAAQATKKHPEQDSNREAPRTRAFALRFTDRARAYLEQKAGSLPLGTYCRRVLLGDKEEKRLILRKPKTDEKQLALVLAALGDSRLSSNVNQLAHHANMGTLDVSPDTEAELKYAMQAIIEMRKALFIALGLKP